jgi:hypothetical protein
MGGNAIPNRYFVAKTSRKAAILRDEETMGRKHEDESQGRG